jgi:glycosyltransferase involved in cell wall biosynthesis
MRVTLVNTMDRSGGAARAANRLHQGLRSIDVDSRMLVQVETGNDDGVTGGRGKTAKAMASIRLLVDQLPVIPHWRKAQGVFAPALLPGNAWRRANRQNADIIHLHWITKAFMGINDIPRLNAPIVWTLHDMWPLTGGCHYDMGCGRYSTGCGKCPVLGSNKTGDLSAQLLSRKRKAWQGLNLTIISPSKWLADCARRSEPLGDFRTEVIPNGIDLDHFRPLPKAEARAALSISPDRKVILFGAMSPTDDSRKGFSQLQTALHTLAEDNSAASLVIFRAPQPDTAPQAILPTQYIGKLESDQDLARLYSAADVFVAPSAQDNLPNTIMEALACGTPCVAFRVGGIPDMIHHESNGYLATPGDSQELARGIDWVLEDAQRWNRLSENARSTAEENYRLSDIAERHKTLYSEILDSHGQGIAGSKA